jgi:diguanylate cyclase (GGDEF)-like protein
VFAALVATSAVIVVCLGGAAIFQIEHGAATERLVNANRWADRILLAGERPAMSATMLVTTGEQRWLDRYESQNALIGEAIRIAGEIAPSNDVERLAAKVRFSHERLVDLERASFEAARSGRAADAQQILDGPLYHYHKDALIRAARALVASVLDTVRAKFSVTQRRSLIAISIGIPLFVFAAAILWRRLNANLEKSQGMYFDAEKKIEMLAKSDVLTGLANRRALREGLCEAIRRADQDKTKLAVLMIDLDRFKPINDRHGHIIGDLVLKEVAKRLAMVVRGGELRGRHGGDEFIAVVEYSSDDEIPRRVGRRLVEALCAPMSFDGITVEIGASVGIAIYPNDAAGDEELVRKADMALYRAKGEGRCDVRFYDMTMERDMAARSEFGEELKRAIRGGGIAPYFQPLVELATGRICGFEVLSRWQHPARGLIPPGEFIHIAEEAGLINELTMGVLQKACLDARSLPPEVSIAINVAPRQIQDERLSQKILAVLTRTRFPAERLEIELTEHALVSDIASAREVIVSLKKLGIKVALDDFGTGYSSLSYLSELPFDKIKIDRSFIRTLHERAESGKIVAAIIGLGSSLGVPTIAEGVESEQDAAVLRSMGCTIAQGYFYSVPVPAAELSTVMDRFSSSETARAVA